MAEKEASLFITGNTADKGGGIGANGGIVIGSAATASVGVTKVWSGDSEQDRPASIKVDLLSNGTVIDTAVLTAADNWSHTFADLPTKDKDGKAYTYTVYEASVSGYTTQITGDAQTGFIITNTKTSTVTPPESTDPTNPTEKQNLDKGTAGSLQTGDNSNKMIWIAAMLLSGAALTGIVFYSRKRKHNR